VTSASHLFLPAGYQRRTAALSRNTAEDGRAYWDGDREFNASQSQWHVYELARLRAAGLSRPRVWDVGSGIGTKLIRLVDRTPGALGVGFDQPFAIEVAQARAGDRTKFVSTDLESFAPRDCESPDVVVCADVIEHLENPIGLLSGLRTCCKPTSSVFISTPDRVRLHGSKNLTPTNLLHVQEWTADEFCRMVECVGFRVVTVRYFPPTRLGFNWRCAKLYADLIRRLRTVRFTMCFELALAEL
jgi:SAM-dependent methyltransferase